MQAALVALLAKLDIRGQVRLPVDEGVCRGWCKRIAERLNLVSTRFQELAAERAGTDRVREDIVALLLHWFIHGRGVT